MTFNWAATDSFTFNERKAKKFVEFDDALVYAEEKRPYRNSTYIWKLTKGKPLKWMEVS